MAHKHGSDLDSSAKENFRQQFFVDLRKKCWSRIEIFGSSKTG